MGDFSVLQLFPQFDEQLFQLEPLPCSEPSLSEDYEDILQNFVTQSNEYITTIDTEKFLSSQNKAEDENSGGRPEVPVEKKDSAGGKTKKEKVRRGRGRPAVRKSRREKRDQANTRERRRMRNLVRWGQQAVKVTPRTRSIHIKKFLKS